MHVEANVYFMHNYTGFVFHWTFTTAKDSSVTLFNGKLFIGYFWPLAWFQLFKTHFPVFLSQHKSVKKSRVLLQGPPEACDRTAIVLLSFPRLERRPSWVQTQHTVIPASFHVLGSCGHSPFPPRTFVFKTQAFPWARYETMIGRHKRLQQVCEENVVSNSGTDKGSGLFSVILYVLDHWGHALYQEKSESEAWYDCELQSFLPHLLTSETAPHFSPMRFPKSRLWLLWSSDRKPPHWNTDCLWTNSGSISFDHVSGCVNIKTLDGAQKPIP